MENTAGHRTATPKDTFGAQELLQLVAKKLSSQILLFSLAVLVLLVVAGTLLGAKDLLIIAAILVVFAMATLGYLFAEQKRKLEHGDEAVVGALVGQRVEALRNPQGDLALQLWTMPAAAAAGSRDIAIAGAQGRRDYRIGEKIVVCFQASRDCYLTLLNIGTSGKLTVLFPNALHRDNFVRAGELYQIPSQEDGFEYQLQGPPGIEKLKAVATLEKIELLEWHFAADGPLFETRVPTAAARDIAVMRQKIDAISSRQWADATWEFRVTQ